MAISPVNDRVSYHPSQHAKPAAQETNQKSDTTLASENSDSVDFSKTSNYSPAYTKANASAARAGNSQFADNRSTRQMKNDLVRDMAKNTISGQVGKGNKNLYKPTNASGTVMEALQAAEATSKGKDYWGVDATAERIFTFAKTLAGDDDEMFQTMKDAFEKGFQQALGAKRGSLPSISYQTRDKVLSLFDEWENEIKAKNSGTETDKANSANKDENTKNAEEKKNPTTTVYGRTYGAETVPYFGAGKYTGHSGTPTKESDK